MADETIHALIRARVIHANVTHQHRTVSAAARDQGPRPSQTADPPGMPFYAADGFLLQGVIDAYVSEIVAYSQMVPTVAPRHRTDHVVFVFQSAQLINFRVTSRPNVNFVLQSNRDEIIRRPIQQVEIEIIL